MTLSDATEREIESNAEAVMGEGRERDSVDGFSDPDAPCLGEENATREEGRRAEERSQREAPVARD